MSICACLIIKYTVVNYKSHAPRIRGGNQPAIVIASWFLCASPFLALQTQHLLSLSSLFSPTFLYITISIEGDWNWNP